MSDDHEVLAACRRTAVLGELVADMSYEVMPFKNTERDVLAHVPTTVRLTVTATAAKGIDATLDLTERLVRQGYTAAPHLPARLFVDRHHVEDVVARLRHNRVSSIFVIGGDAPTPTGSYPDALSLLEALAEANHPFNDVGIGGYPEGHGTIPQEAIDLSMKQKALMATRAITQICFDAKTTTAWAGGMAASGIGLPIYVGMPGPVNRQKLMRISAGIGLGPSARFLQKQQSLLWRFLLPGGYNPTKLLKSLAGAALKTDTNIRGLHIFTFNELQKTELWRQQLLAPFIERDERP